MERWKHEKKNKRRKEKRKGMHLMTIDHHKERQMLWMVNRELIINKYTLDEFHTKNPIEWQEEHEKFLLINFIINFPPYDCDFCFTRTGYTAVLPQNSHNSFF